MHQSCEACVNANCQYNQISMGFGADPSYVCGDLDVPVAGGRRALAIKKLDECPDGDNFIVLLSTVNCVVACSVFSIEPENNLCECIT